MAERGGVRYGRNWPPVRLWGRCHHLVYDYAVGHLHDAALYALEFITCAGQLYEQEKVNHGVDGSLTLSHTYSLYEYLVKTSSLTEHYGLTGLTGHATQ